MHIFLKIYIQFIRTEFLRHGLLTSALQMLHDLKEYALKHKLTFYLAQSYKYLGEYYLKEGTPENSTPLLKIALKLFNDGNYISEAESVRNYAAISIGKNSFITESWFVIMFRNIHVIFTKRILIFRIFLCLTTLHLSTQLV